MLVAEPAHVQPYDFRRPNKLNREHYRALQIVGETFARQLTTVLSTSLRTICQAAVDDVAQQTYDEYVQGLPNPTLLTVLDLAPLKGFSMFTLPTGITMSVIDRLLGGTGTGTMPERPPTEIELRLLRGVIERAMRELAYAFESITPITPTITRSETNPQFAQVAASTDMIIVLTFSVRVDEQRDSCTLALPFTSIAPALDLTTRSSSHDPDGRAQEIRAAVEESLAQADLAMRVRFNQVELPSRQVAALRPGDILPLGHAVDAPLVVEVAGLPRFLATPGTRGKRVACLITDTIGEVTIP